MGNPFGVEHEISKGLPSALRSGKVLAGSPSRQMLATDKVMANSYGKLAGKMKAKRKGTPSYSTPQADSTATAGVGFQAKQNMRYAGVSPWKGNTGKPTRKRPNLP